MTRVPAHILTTLILIITLAGCSPPTRHKVLNFFFTGIPPLEEDAVIEQSKEQLISPAVSLRRIKAPKETLFSHPVWAAGICDPCHATSSDYSVPGVKQKSASVFKTGGGMVGKLTLPKNMLCIQCHKDKTPQRAMAENLWLHNTTAKGDCLACHDPHQSKNRKTLRQPPARLCITSCHDKGTYIVTPVHQTGDECLTCHNPHLGSNRNLLKREYKEMKIPVTEIPGHPELSR